MFGTKNLLLQGVLQKDSRQNSNIVETLFYKDILGTFAAYCISEDFGAAGDIKEV